MINEEYEGGQIFNSFKDIEQLFYEIVIVLCSQKVGYYKLFLLFK